MHELTHISINIDLFRVIMVAAAAGFGWPFGKWGARLMRFIFDESVKAVVGFFERLLRKKE